MATEAQRGRPKKYGRPARAVTVTLPEDVLTKLAAIHPDVGSAIVRLVERMPRPRIQPVRSTEVARYGNHAVILVTPIRALKRLRGVELIPIGDGRALISLAPSMAISALELQVRDAIEGNVDHEEQEVLESVAEILRRGRATREVTLEERTIIVLGRSRRRINSRAGVSER
jgi:hypothetical protein